MRFASDRMASFGFQEIVAVVASCRSPAIDGRKATENENHPKRIDEFATQVGRRHRFAELAGAGSVGSRWHVNAPLLVRAP